VLSRRARLWLAGLLVLMLTAPLALSAQRGGFFGGGRFRGYILPNVPYDGQFTFARIRYLGRDSWDADYPRMERHLTTILDSLTSIRTHMDASNVHTFDDPELMKYPVAYLTEPGYWVPTDEEVAGLRRYLDKGAFLIVDDFYDPDFHYGREWQTFEAGIRRVLPDARIEPLDVSHPVFNSFFQVQSLALPYPGRWGERGLMGEFYGIYKDNDPSQRLSVIINYNMDVGDYVEWSDTSEYTLAPTNEAYKLMINYVIYGLTR
jgi:hypothetical protein